MTSNSTSENSKKHSSGSLIARAHCIFSDVDSRVLYATELSLTGAFILSMRLPEMGTLLSIVFYPEGQPPLCPIECRVIGCRLDPSNAEKSGFEVVFTSLDKEQFNSLSSALNVLQDIKRPRPPSDDDYHDEIFPERIGAERRIYPRVSTNLHVSVHFPDELIIMQLVNVSMSGALLGFGENEMSSQIQLGTELSLTITNTSAPESVSVQARVVRFSTPDEPKGFAVHFIELSEVLSGRIEGLLMSILSEDALLC